MRANVRSARALDMHLLLAKLDVDRTAGGVENSVNYSIPETPANSRLPEPTATSPPASTPQVVPPNGAVAS